MSVPVTREGTFRGIITEYGLRETDGGALGISFKAMLSDWHYEHQNEAGEMISEWYPWADQNEFVEGSIWIIKKDGKTNESGVKSAFKAGWDGDLASVESGDWKPIPCQFVVKSESYKNKRGEEVVTLKAAFVNGYDDPVGKSYGNVDQDKVKALNAKYGGAFRALAGSASKPKAPSTPPPKPGTTTKLQTESLQPTTNAANRAAMQTENASGDGIPF